MVNKIRGTLNVLFNHIAVVEQYNNGLLEHIVNNKTNWPGSLCRISVEGIGGQDFW